MRKTIEQLLGNQSLTQEESREIMYSIMSGKYNDAQISGFLIALRAKGESSTEIAGFAQAMRDKMTEIDIDISNFEIKLIKDSLNSIEKISYTDEASLIEELGLDGRIVFGITYQRIDKESVGSFDVEVL